MHWIVFISLCVYVSWFVSMVTIKMNHGVCGCVSVYKYLQIISQPGKFGNFDKKKLKKKAFYAIMKFYNWKKNTPRKNCINVMLIEWLLSHQFKCVSANAISCYGKNDSHRTKIYTCTIFKFKCFKTEEKEIKFKSIFSMFIVCLFVFFRRKCWIQVE